MVFVGRGMWKEGVGRAKGRGVEKSGRYIESVGGGGRLKEGGL